MRSFPSRYSRRTLSPETTGLIQIVHFCTSQQSARDFDSFLARAVSTGALEDFSSDACDVLSSVRADDVSTITGNRDLSACPANETASPTARLTVAPKGTTIFSDLTKDKKSSSAGKRNRATGRSSKTDRAMELYYVLDRKPIVRLMNSAIDVCSRARPTTLLEAFEIFEQGVGPQTGLTPNIFSFGAFMNACNRAGSETEEIGNSQPKSIRLRSVIKLFPSRADKTRR